MDIDIDVHGRVFESATSAGARVDVRVGGRAQGQTA